MSTYNLNEVLKARKAEETGRKSSNGEEQIKLDDVTRVKVLSPGRQVFKRFIRNRLAVFGSITLIVLFMFSFLGPLVYPYGQKEIFYTYRAQNVNYALAKENTAYNGYKVSDAVIDKKVDNTMNSNIKSMIAADQDMRILFDEAGNAYAVRKLGYEVYSIGTVSAEEICVVGESDVKVGSFNPIQGIMTFSGEEVKGLEEALKKKINKSFKDSSAEVELDGTVYTVTRASKLDYQVQAHSDGVNFTGSVKKDKGFADMVEAAVENGQSRFSVGSAGYVINYAKGNATVYAVDDEVPGKVYTRFTVDTFETAGKVSEEFRAQALMNAYEGGTFSADGNDYTVVPGDQDLIVYDRDGKEFAEFSTFTVRRYTGEDSMEYGLKKAVEETIRGIEAKGQKSGTMNYGLPLQDPDTGVYTYDDNGELQYLDTEINITQRDTGEYVLNCDQVTFVIDMYAKPSAEHFLGTDGDGFDVMSRIMYGGRISLMVGFVVVFLETFLGIIMGGLAGFYGGWVDNLIMRLVDIFYCLPSTPIMIILGAMMDAMRMNTYIRLLIMMAALGIMGWAGVARLVRGQILSLREQEFMLAAEATGIRVKHRIFKHLIPNVMPQLIVTATMGIGGVIITESTLSFLGLGVKHPLATWGTIINSVSSASAMQHYTFIWIPVGLLICLTVIAFNFVGDGLRDAYDPKAKR